MNGRMNALQNCKRMEKEKVDLAKDEIKDVLLKYDLAGFILLQSPDAAATYIRVDPTHSCLFIRDNCTIGLSMDSRQFKGNMAQMVEALAESILITQIFSQQLTIHADNFTRMFETLKAEFAEKFNVDYGADDD